ncbi:MAG TPA: TetR/AcrR family transcriptional regulator [Microbacterium sp.]|uniref:TetR/AcrR family transcriptional regulator n=1 Tax=Microbacterium sp. TaxID=51671 RepID=UPI002B83C7D5|nr:TetR/AcrR family transcriptional regulator [Microbacterium sp.]HWI29990.1 TetR/AcrR family transcriptional regulator [Microbacterium sp.]
MNRKQADEAVVTSESARRMSSVERREQIIAAAVAVFGARGYVGTTTDEVARAASVSQPYVVRLFGTKEKLFLAALDDCLARLLAAFRAVPPITDLQERTETMGQAYLRLLEVRGLHQLLSQAFLLGAHPVIGPAAREGFATVWRYLREAGFGAEDAQKFLAAGMLINTMIGLRLTEEYGSDSGMTELFDECFPVSIQMVLDAAPRVDEPW